MTTMVQTRRGKRRNSGLMRDKAVFERRDADAIDDMGNESDAWTEVGSRLSDMVERSGRDQVEDGARQEEGDAFLILRADDFTDGITIRDRVTVRDETWKIRSKIQTSDTKRFYKLTLEKGVAQ